MPITTAFILVLSFYVPPAHQSGFSSPNYVVSYGPGQYQSNRVWYVGETRDVVYDISDMDGFNTYTIALWQQKVSGGGASLGPVVNSKAATDEARDSFTWTVDLYEFNVDWSNVFFFWIFNGSESNQGNTDVPNVSSAFFNITADDPPTSSSSTSSETSSTSSETSATSSETSTTSSATSATSSPTSATETSTQPTQTTSGSAATVPTSEATNSRSSETGSSGGISTGAGIGIGVGIGLAAIAAVVCAAIIVWYKRKKRASNQDNTHHDGMHELPSRIDRQPSPKRWHMPPVFSTHDAPPKYGSTRGSGTEPGGPTPQAINHGHPAELNAGPGWPVELNADGRDRPQMG